MEAFRDAVSNQIVRDESAGNDTVSNGERSQTGATNNMQERILIEVAKIYAADRNVTNVESPTLIAPMRVVQWFGTNAMLPKE
ncbi:hypothetical protein AAVH_39220 [Aphelenchoides avenae]|nr:hypothetical protein AAVH_39220 [Aphelenchus avenae]